MESGRADAGVFGGVIDFVAWAGVAGVGLRVPPGGGLAGAPSGGVDEGEVGGADTGVLEGVSDFVVGAGFA